MYGGTAISETTDQRAILFADVCESTTIYEAIGDVKALGLINSLFKALDKEVKENGGATVKTLGDGMICQFREPDAAFRAACDMQAVKPGSELGSSGSQQGGGLLSQGGPKTP